MSHILKRLASTSTITIKPTPSKNHLHGVLSDHAFPEGYSLTGVHCGVKKKAGVPDLAVIVSSRPASAAASFTRNAFKAAPVLVSQDVLASTNGKVRGIVVNSGCANAVTGKQGMEDAWAMVNATDALFDGKKETMVMSTGVIGQNLPISKVLAGIHSIQLGTGFKSWELAARAFMTTDTFPKLRARTFTIDGKEYRMAGMDKGAGMIHPNMGPPASSGGQLHATLLGTILTDAPVNPTTLQSALNFAVDRSFNSISVDGDMSTNDTILVLANGNGPQIDEHKNPEAFEAFKTELTSFAVDLAKLVVRDGEGATKFVTVNVNGAKTYADAHKIASSISTSALVKTALYGEDANWGRILAAAGSVTLSLPLDPTTVNVSFIPSPGTSNSTPLAVLINGEPEQVDEIRAKEILSEDEFEVLVELRQGEENATYWTCDFSYEYVQINGDYRS